MATVLVARLEREAGGRMRMRWSSAGHLPPVVVAPDGRLQLLDGPRPGLVLGVQPTVARADAEVLLDRGSTLLLYTDGLVERRDQGFDDGIALLGRALAELRELPLEAVCDALLERLLPERAEDDVALVAVRLAPDDRPATPGGVRPAR
jgi:serine phosphatase RsbU (regulator of sigma subunit)